MKKIKLDKIGIIVFFVIITLIGANSNKREDKNTINNIQNSYDITNIPKYNGEIYVQINNNNPTFSVEDINIEHDYYSTLENGKARKSNNKN